jgi:hypothetical protein
MEAKNLAMSLIGSRNGKLHRHLEKSDAKAQQLRDPLHNPQVIATGAAGASAEASESESFSASQLLLLWVSQLEQAWPSEKT